MRNENPMKFDHAPDKTRAKSQFNTCGQPGNIHSSFQN